MTRWRVACAVAALALCASRAAAEAPPCLVSASAPARAFVGEQIVRRIRILRRPDVSAASWVSGPASPGFRAEPLPGLSGETRVQEQGATYLVFQERMALFPVRAGALTLPAARLECALHALPGQPARAFVATLAKATLLALAPPTEGRPADWGGLVGALRLSVEAEPRRLALGQTIHVSVSLEGEADLRDAPAPFAGAREIAGAEVFAARPQLQLDPGERLSLRRSVALQLVPRQIGPFLLPAMRVPFFDPRTGRYAVAASPAIEIRVDPADGS